MINHELRKAKTIEEKEQLMSEGWKYRAQITDKRHDPSLYWVMERFVEVPEPEELDPEDEYDGGAPCQDILDVEGS